MGEQTIKLRPYQQKSVDKVLEHFRREKSPAVIVLPTGAGKSIVIAELARLARGRVLVLAHVKELVEQNYNKFIALGIQGEVEAGLFSAGLNKKETTQKVLFGSIQSVARADETFFENFSLLIIDECHRVGMDEDTQYFHVIHNLQAKNPNLCVLGLTATPYRLGLGWIYQWHVPKNRERTAEERFFKKCVFELEIKTLIQQGFLTKPVMVDAPVASYDFSSLKIKEQSYSSTEIESVLKDQKRITPVIIKNIIELSEKKNGVMIFTSSVNHAREILKLLPPFVSALVTGETSLDERDEIIEAFKKQELKYLVNVSVLTTGFDAPHVDVIALLRPTESQSLFQQIVGRGLRLFPGKKDCLVLDYTGQGHNLYYPEIGEDRPHNKSQLVAVACPKCLHENQFWGEVDADGDIIEHYGRKCQGISEDESRKVLTCNYRFRFKVCHACGCEQDIAARTCTECQAPLVDDEKKLKEAMSLKDAHVMRVDSMDFLSNDKSLEVRYYDADGEHIKEFFRFEYDVDQESFKVNFIRMHDRLPGRSLHIRSAQEAKEKQTFFRPPKFVVARKKKHYWEVRFKVF